MKAREVAVRCPEVLGVHAPCIALFFCKAPLLRLWVPASDLVPGPGFDMGLPKIRVPCVGVLVIRILLFRVLY